MPLEDTLAELSALDCALNSAGAGDFEGLAVSLERRAVLVQAAAAEISRLRDSARTAPAHTRQTLEKSSNAGMRAMRQIILAKHMLSTELARLKQEQRLLEALSSPEPAPAGRIELHA